MPAIIPYAATAPTELLNQVRPIVVGGGIVAIPTETFYGLGVNPLDGAAVEHLCAVKGRADGAAILVLVGTLDAVSLFTEHVPPAASSLIEAFWPGALTLLFPARPSVPRGITGGTGRVGIRLTSCVPLRDVLARVGPLTGTSANRTGAPPACTAREVHDVFGEEVDAIIDAGPTPGGLPSTVLEADEVLRVVREGAIPRSAIESALHARGFSLKKA